MKTNVEAYLNAVDRALLCNKVQKKRVLRQLTTDIETFCDANGEPTAEQLEKHFGTAEEMAVGLLRQTDVAELQKSLCMRKIILACVIITCIIALISLVCFLIHRAKMQEDIAHGYCVETIYEHTVDGTPPPPEETDRVY